MRMVGEPPMELLCPRGWLRTLLDDGGAQKLLYQERKIFIQDLE